MPVPSDIQTFESSRPTGRDSTLMLVQIELILKQDQPVLRQILKPLGLSYVQFARRLEIDIATLEKYRRGDRQFRFSTHQAKVLIDLLDQVGLTLKDLPDDWIIEKPNRNHIEPSI